MKAAIAFFTLARQSLFGGKMSVPQVDGCNAILDAMAGTPLAHCAYALATAFHETGRTMQPIHEKGGPIYFKRMYDPQGERPRVAAELGNTVPGDGVRFHGRGYVQLTGRRNYAKAGAETGVDLLADPDRALEPLIAAKIMRFGMSEGWFTGRKLADYFPGAAPAGTAAFVQARWIINRQDNAETIADYAVRFQNALIVGGW